MDQTARLGSYPEHLAPLSYGEFEQGMLATDQALFEAIRTSNLLGIVAAHKVLRRMSQEHPDFQDQYDQSQVKSLPE